MKLILARDSAPDEWLMALPSQLPPTYYRRIADTLAAYRHYLASGPDDGEIKARVAYLSAP